MMDPCGGSSLLVHTIIASNAVLCSLFGVWLTHKRRKADQERKFFYRVMLERHGMVWNAKHGWLTAPPENDQL